MRIQFFSDIHLEFAPFAVPDTDADVIVAAGDIGRAVSGVHWLLALARPAVYVAGNHEYYGGDFDEVRAAIGAACAGTAVRFLDRAAVEIDGVRFVGATLWTDYAGGDATAMRLLRLAMNDHQQIRRGTRAFEPEDAYAEHRAARAWLESTLASAYEGPTVVVTHHAPALRSWRAPEDSAYRHAYCSALEALVAASGAAAWFHGHVHWVVDYTLGRTRVLCNPRGYHGLQHVAGFDPGRVIEIAPT